jgi:hypothetical protein
MTIEHQRQIERQQQDEQFAAAIAGATGESNERALELCDLLTHDERQRLCGSLGQPGRIAKIAAAARSRCPVEREEREERRTSNVELPTSKEREERRTSNVELPTSKEREERRTSKEEEGTGETGTAQ